MATKRPEVERIDAELAAVLPVASLYAVGGRVRDEVRSSLDGVARAAKDLDYVVVGIDFEDLIERLRKLGRADRVGAAFAVVKVTLQGTTVDVALPRRERSTGAGHREFAVEAGAGIPLEDDLARRDFRMNMLARALPSGALIDPYGGEADIRLRRIDLLRPQAFSEDPLRMLRACQFAARFEYELTPATLRAMQAAASAIVTISADRIRDELDKLLVLAPKPSIGLEAMRAGAILDRLLPELAEGIGVAQNLYHAFDVYGHSLATVDATAPGDVVLRLAALLHDVAKPRTKSFEPPSPAGAHFYGHEVLGAVMARDLLERLRFSNAVGEAVAHLVRQHMYAADPRFEPKTIRRFIRRVGPAELTRLFALRAADIAGSGLPKRDDSNELFQARVEEVLSERPSLSVRDLAVNGEDVVAALVTRGRLPSGSRGGPEVGRILSALLERVIDRPELNERAALLHQLGSLASKGSVSRETLSASAPPPDA